MTTLKSDSLVYNGPALLSMFESALRLIEANVAELNRLNVFPVPDGDTGTNMYLTVSDTVSKSGARVQDSVAETSKVMAEEALDGGRGNSGVILSQFFSGMAEALEGRADFGGRDLVRSLVSASIHAYEAVGHPREGTMLTVMRETAEAVEGLDEDDMARVLSVASQAALSSVARTPTLLPMLYKAGLVDAGGYGVYVMLEGMRRHVLRDAELDELLVPPQPDMGDGNISPEFLDEIEEEEFGFCTQFLLQGEGLDKESIKARLLELGTSPVIIGSEDTLRIHVHTYNPDEVVGYAASLGSVSRENIQDMDEQRRNYSADRRTELAGEALTIVSVVQGEGLESVFRESGIEHFVSGGDTMNPSVGDLLGAINDAPTDAVLMLPNNPNVMLAAEKAADRAPESKRVRVVGSRTVIQGIAAALAYAHEDFTLDSLANSMEERLGDVRTGEICLASRDADLGVSVEENQIIALLDRELVYGSDTIEDTLAGLLEEALDEDSELVTMYWGDLLNENDAQNMMASVEKKFPEIEFDLIYGGQPHYHLFISVE